MRVFARPTSRRGRGSLPASPLISRQVAVDGLSLDIPRGRITALLGHNGAGKSTTISILTGLLPATAGDVLFFPASGGGGGLSVARDMAAIRGTLGVCPQYDVLWPQLSVREHLELFAAIKGFTTRWAGRMSD